MRYSLFFLCFILNGCWYSNGCFYTPQMVNCVDKGKEYPLIAGYQKKELLGHTNSKQRWKDLVSCGGKYGDINLHYYPQNYQINDKRYKKHIGKKIILPMINKSIPIFGESTIDTVTDN